MRLKTLIWTFILLLVIAFITYEVITETVVKPVRAIQSEVRDSINQVFRQLEP